MQNYRNMPMDCTRKGNLNPTCRCVQDMVEERIEEFPVAMAYVPWQKWRKIYSKEKGFMRGTMFEELDKPFWAAGGCK